ncbi:hypothetical protein M513_11180 [Trichuris suis]|uniref:Uncharacterized protein n=1 Tax=Trichuris suis TaxID=68888 RepID=A0A085LSK1_9BILA|nr:hypothetical protein M513_11180 [Trichuris suis]
MRPSLYCILPLLLPLLSAVQWQNESSKEQNHKLIENLADTIGDYLPKPELPPCQRKDPPWRTAAKNVLAELTKLMHGYSNVTLDKVILGTKCNATAEATFIVQLRILIKDCKKGSRQPCADPPKNAYCSWIGSLDGLRHEKLYGAICYITERLSEEEEWTLATMDVCKLWRYADTKYFRVLIPVGLQNWKKSLLLYYPVATDLSTHHALVSTMGQSQQNVRVNPQGRAGILGQGVMKHLGENLMELPILLRDNGRRREILLSSTNLTGISMGPFPLFYRRHRNYNNLHLNVTHAEDYFYSLVRTANGTKCGIEEFRKEMKQKRKLSNARIYHPHETDNAWVKLKIYFLTVPRKSCLYNLKLNSSANYFHLLWKSYDDARLQSVKSVIDSHFNVREARAITAESYLQRAYYMFYLSTAAAAAVLLGSVLAYFVSPIIFVAAVIPVILALAGATALIYKRNWLSINDGIKSCNK